MDQLAAISEYIYDVVKPGNIAVIERAITAENKDQRSDEIQTAITGARPYRLDVGKSFQYKSYRFKSRLQNANKLKYDNYDESVEATGNVLKEFHNSYQNALLLGVSKEQLNKTLKNVGFSKKQIYAIKTGIIPQFIVTKPK